jgi:hypothetical protein
MLAVMIMHNKLQMSLAMNKQVLDLHTNKATDLPLREQQTYYDCSCKGCMAIRMLPDKLA